MCLLSVVNLRLSCQNHTVEHLPCSSSSVIVIFIWIFAIFGEVNTFSIASHICVVYVKRFFTIVVDHLWGISSCAMIHHEFSNFCTILLRKELSLYAVFFKQNFILYALKFFYFANRKFTLHHVELLSPGIYGIEF